MVRDRVGTDGAAPEVEPFDFEAMPVFTLALEVAEAADEIAIGQKDERPWAASQIGSAGLSVLNNTAEALGEYSPGDKARIFRYALRSAWETAAMVVFLARRGALAARIEARARTALLNVIKNLTRLCIHHSKQARARFRPR